MWWIILSRFVRHQPIQYQCANSFYRRHTLFNKRTARWVEIQFGWDSERGGCILCFLFSCQVTLFEALQRICTCAWCSLFSDMYLRVWNGSKNVTTVCYQCSLELNEFFLTILSYRKREWKRVIEILRNTASLFGEEWW